MRAFEMPQKRSILVVGHALRTAPSRGIAVERVPAPESQLNRTMRQIDWNPRNLIALLGMAASCIMSGCSSNAEPPDLTPPTANALILQRWSRDELNHFAISLHSDSLIECGVKNDLWKLAESTERGYRRTAYQLTDRGNRTLFAIDLKESGKGHEITFRGPYRLEITNITPGAEPDTRRVEFRWEIDWDKTPAELKACVPKFEMSGNLVGLFKLYGLEWRFLSYSKPDDASAPQGAAPVVDKLP